MIGGLLTLNPEELDQDQKILTAIRNIVLEAQLTPQSTLATRDDESIPASAGGTDVWVTDPRQFNPGGPFNWGDNVGEEDLTIAKTWNRENPIPLWFGGLEYQALRYDHLAAGAPVFANLFDTTPDHFDHMFDSDDPVVFVDADRESNTTKTFAQNAPTLSCTLSVYVSLIQQQTVNDDGEYMDANIFTRRQRKRCKHILDTIKLALWQRWDLINQLDTYQSSGFGDWSNPGTDLFTKSWRESIGPDKELWYVGRAQFPVMGNYVLIGFDQ